MSAKSLAAWKAKNHEYMLEYARKYYRKHKERILQTAKEYAIKNREIVRERKRRHRLKNREKISAKFEEWRLKKTYGITVEQWDGIKKSQNYLCGACGVKSGLAVDHCHKTGIVRGALCRTCNLALGHARDSVDVLNGLIKYLGRQYEGAGTKN